MFCTNCGKEIIDTARFCNFCGAPVKNTAGVPSAQTGNIRQEQPADRVTPTMQSEPVTPTIQPEQSAQSEYTAPESETGIPMPERAPEASETASEMPSFGSEPENADVYENAADNSELTAESVANDSAIPTPNTIPSYGGSAYYSAPPVSPNIAEQPLMITQEIKSETAPEVKPERKYTFGHLMMCLAAVAIMAIVAGVFAGLYFSVA